ncbi:leucine-rich repeat domain-containing protein [Treponema parvum]|uniref:Leucine-rich repeat domain-containing protein n=1 Tax=Treponema parvum TaxID=138851 RepID=A0A975EXN6_9SPIR|nr:leucine-rich repeat domain-containing protein [Treponema parvum]QTQ10886.1 leucine-rich repeat domain-containing protein [Treponema parvum]
MTKFKTHNKKGAAAIITVAVLALIALFGMTACSNAAQSGTGTGGSTALPEAPFVEGGASLILSPGKLDIKVKVTTSDGSSVTVEGCEETTLTSDSESVLYAKGTTVILKGNITELRCLRNQLTALNVQGCTALQELKCGFNKLTALDVQDLTALKELSCHGNRLNAEAFTKLFNDLPQQANSNRANCILYIEKPGFTDDNHTDFTAPPDLAEAFNNAKSKKRWVMLKMTVDNNGELHWIRL